MQPKDEEAIRRRARRVIARLAATTTSPTADAYANLVEAILTEMYLPDPPREPRTPEAP